MLEVITEVRHYPPLFQYGEFLLRPFYHEDELYWGLRRTNGTTPLPDEVPSLKADCDFISVEPAGSA
jgi:hypothetical protein